MACTLRSSAQVEPIDQYTGFWVGTTYLYKSGSLSDSIPSSLLILTQPGDTSWSWKTTYESQDGPIIKDYVLRLKDSIQHQWIMDEGDGIELLLYQFSDKLYSSFQVEETYLNGNYRFSRDEITFEITSGKKIGPTTDSIYNYSIEFMQKTVFHKPSNH